MTTGHLIWSMKKEHMWQARSLSSPNILRRGGGGGCEGRDGGVGEGVDVLHSLFLIGVESFVLGGLQVVHNQVLAIAGE